MKTLVVILLIYAMMALTVAAAVPEAESEVKMGEPSLQEDDDHIVKRSKSCPPGWSGYGGRCFLYVSTLMNWANAEKTCLRQGGNLVSVHNKREHNFIQSMIKKLTNFYPLTWIGGSDAQQEGTWFWSDGTPFDFTYWDAGQPNNLIMENCLIMNSGVHKRFDDKPCFFVMPFVCARKA